MVLIPPICDTVLPSLLIFTPVSINKRHVYSCTGGEGREVVTPQDRSKAAAAHKKYRTAWRDRKAKVRIGWRRCNVEAVH